ncbi:carboxylate--amine ligase [Azospirillum picis]|uniref:ATP-grasp superfamily ATP-dependent carboligase n=1 Tax=Azospirillum picis TaxID=488438 RepID=A0ABU0MGW4_9PROT|nr:ATP-grasp domain-containing protein [Azospirillum picis]MBP2299066.1 putative ATP-grasp superfamily ATP-dependent carboligase [Azospirillum picis]MDQ0532692.1 putative ATP-grasp superfamily ATP-dependent carboligase [Azospirillum picis]
MTKTGQAHGPLACVLGDMDLVRPLGLAKIRCAVVAPGDSAAAHSRFTDRLLAWDGACDGALVDRLLRFGAAHPEKPVLYFQDDAQLLMVSRHRDRLAGVFRFALASPDLVETLVDKGRFQELADRLDLPVPRTRRLRPAPGSEAPELDLDYPLIVKPLTRRPPWDEIEGWGKAIRLDGPEDLRALWPRLIPVGIDLLAQEMVPGAETRIESHHLYIDPDGEVAGEFTGRKIRTYPLDFGHSTALTITDIHGEGADVAALGRGIAKRIGLTGVAKFDFKRGPDGRLHLLEINPRFNLWHHLGAVAGVNLPALVQADLTGRPRPTPASATARPGARWCHISRDRLAARDSGVPTLRWVAWVAGCEAKAIMPDDPMPFLRPKLDKLLARIPGGRPPRLAKP